jgi:tetratricopeptide (TPR) repeat protein
LTNTKLSITQLQQAIIAQPDNHQLLAQLGELYCAQQQYELAHHYFHEAIQRQPNYYWAMAHQGETYRLQGNYAAALTHFNQSLTIKADYVWAIAHRGMTYRLMGKAYYTLALTDFNQAIQLKPDYAWAIAYRCRIYDLLRCYQAALIDFDQAIALDPNLFDNKHSERGMLLSYCGRYEEAIAACQLALQENPHDHFALYNIAVFKMRWQGLSRAQTEIETARTTLQSALDTPDRGIVLYRLGGLAALAGHTELALQFLQPAILLDKTAIDFALHDIAWLDLREHPQFQSLVVEK